MGADESVFACFDRSKGWHFGSGLTPTAPDGRIYAGNQVLHPFFNLGHNSRMFERVGIGSLHFCNSGKTAIIGST